MHSFKISVNGWSKQTYTRLCTMMIADTACALPLPQMSTTTSQCWGTSSPSPSLYQETSTPTSSEVYPKGFKGQWVKPHSWFCISKVFMLFLQIVCCPMRRGMSWLVQHVSCMWDERSLQDSSSIRRGVYLPPTHLHTPRSLEPFTHTGFLTC